MCGLATVADLARDMTSRAGVEVRPRDISDLFYNRRVPDDRCPILGGRRLIPLDLLPVIEAKLRERGVIGGRAEGGRS